MITIETVDEYLAVGCMRCPLGNTPDCKVHRWHDELTLLRQLVIETGLQETIRWGVPTYQWEGKNVLIVSASKEFCALNLFKGAFISDPHNLMVSPGPNSRSAMWVKFTTVNQIESCATPIKDLIRELINVELSGLKAPQFTRDDLNIPSELLELLNADPALSSAFLSLTLGRQRSYMIHINGAKQSESRKRRAQKCIEKLFSGLGYNEYQ